MKDKTYLIAVPDEDGIFIPVKDGEKLTFEEALDKAKDFSQSPACEGTPYTIFHLAVGEKAIGIYLNGHLWRRETNPVTDYQIGWADYEDEEESLNENSHCHLHKADNLLEVRLYRYVQRNWHRPHLRPLY